jgi:sterol desaturase/sphingolipid hydroxylase (fatty acid hydroxylase superfamily)
MELLNDIAVRPLLFALLVGLTFAPLEALLALRTGPRPGRTTDLAFATLGQVLTRALLTLGLGALLAFADEFALTDTPFSFVAHAGLRRALDLLLALLVFELSGYLYHRLAHAVPALWRLHEVHHSSESMDWLAAFRQHPLEIVLMTLCQNLPLVLLGVPLGQQLLCVLLLKLNTVFVHANLRVPESPLSLLLATPRFHHRHHQRQGESKNFASLFPFIDRLFGSYSATTSEEFGVLGRLPRTFVGLLIHPFRRSETRTWTRTRAALR